MPNFDFIEDKEVRAKVEEQFNAETKAITESVEQKIEEAVSGLKSKNTELLDEKKKIQEVLSNFGDMDPEKAREAVEFLEKNADAQLIKEGKIDELLDKRTSAMRSDHEAIVSDLTAKLKEAETGLTSYKSQYESKIIDDALREYAVQAKVRPEAISDIVMRGRTIFSLAEDMSLEARDHQGNLRKTDDDKVLVPKNWIEGLKKDSPHYWPASESAGLRGKGGYSNSSDYNTALSNAAKKGDMASYRKMRKKQQGKN